MTAATVKQQTGALVQKSWVFQKRNLGQNICLCAAPIFFCVILGLIQVLVDRALLSSDDLKCGCFCTQCCPDWAVTSQPGNFTANGNGTITIDNIATFGGYQQLLTTFPPGAVTNNSDGTVTVQTCGPIANGPCPTVLGYTCLSTDTNTCGIQFSSASQAQWCAVPQPSTWPGVIQSPPVNERAKPWGATVVNSTITVPRTATLITAQNPSLVTSAGNLLFRGNISTSPAVWTQALTNLYAGNASNPAVGNIFHGDMLSLLGLLFGTDADAQISLYFERAFQPGQDLFTMLPAGECMARGISTGTFTCLSEFLTQFLSSDPSVPPSLLAQLPPCGPIVSSNPNQLLSAPNLRVLCTENQVIPSPNANAIDDELYCGYYQARCNQSIAVDNQYQGAFDYAASAPGTLDLNVYFNETFLQDSAGGSPSRVGRLPGSLGIAVQAWWTAVTGDPGTSLQLLGVMSMPKAASKLTLDFSSLLGPLFFCWVVQLLLPTFLQQLVYEKEKRLRMMMKMHGLGDVAYWTVTYLWYLLLYVIFIIIFMVVGAAIRLKMFLKTAIGIQIIFYFLFGNCMIALAFMLSSLFSSSRTAVVVAFLYVFASGLIGELLLQPFMAEDKTWVFFVEWIPAWALYRGLYEISQYTFLGVYRNSSGMTWSDLTDPGNGMLACWGIFIVEWAVFLVMGWYLEQVLSSGTGIRRRPLFFIEWLWRKPEHAKHGTAAGPEGDRTSVDRGSRTSLDRKLETIIDMNRSRHGAAPGDVLRDVTAEKERVRALAADDTQDSIVIRDIKKTYPGMDGGPPKVAVRDLTLGIHRGECFGLLGPNGAGKTTTLNMLVGFLEPTSGTAVVEGWDINEDMRSIYRVMGVCPQHDLLWESLSGREHLRFYGRLKGLTGAELEGAIDVALKSVNLWNAGVGNKLAGTYSGGMKRRLSVAISFMGDPKVVYLDEPSTGLDPASRRALWDVVQSSKGGRSIILTTHSMEEAEQLCDRLGIFVDGQLVCIGAPKEITARYAGFFVFTLTVPPDQEQAARDMVTRMSPGAVLTYALGGTLKYELPTCDVSLSGVFNAVNAAKAQLTILDWGVANATLEEVFIKLAKGIGAKSDD